MTLTFDLENGISRSNKWHHAICHTSFIWNIYFICLKGITGLLIKGVISTGQPVNIRQDKIQDVVMTTQFFKIGALNFGFYRPKFSLSLIPTIMQNFTLGASGGARTSTRELPWSPFSDPLFNNRMGKKQNSSFNTGISRFWAKIQEFCN